LSPSRLVDGAEPLILDASSALNLLGSGRAADILRALGRGAVMLEEAAEEVHRDPLGGGPGAAAIGALAGAGLLRVAPLSPAGYAVFVGLVAAAPPDGLDDGEAATAAHAADGGGVPVLDEKKGTRIASALPAPAPVCTLDLLSHPRVAAALRGGELADAVHSALLHARMRVPAPFRPWVLGLVGAARLRGCASVPRRWFEPRSGPLGDLP